jgi:molecular chaperone GrpE (heat shock protein)
LEAANLTEQAANDRALELVTLLLPVLDNFDRALATETNDATYAEGVRLSYRQLLRFSRALV